MVKSWKKTGWLLLALPLAAGSAFGDPADSAPFKPHWGFMVGFNSAGTPGDKGGGQNANDISFTVTRELSEGGDFFSAGIMGGSQKVEGSFAKYGSLTLDGGLGLGIFSPSLSLSAQTGESSFALSGALNLGFQVVGDINLGLNVTGGLSNRKAPGVELDSKNFGGGLSVIWATSDIFSLSLGGQTSAEVAYQLILGSGGTLLKIPLSNLGTVAIPSASLGFNWAFIKDFTLSGSFQRSEEIQPAGIGYSPSLGESFNNPAPQTLYFSGYNLGLTFSFQ
jgi:hypothetical protein